MPADWSRPVDVDRLADAEETREFDVALAEFPQLADQIAASPSAEGLAAAGSNAAVARGRARGRVGVARERRVTVVEAGN